jgi:hypothetical protein
MEAQRRFRPSSVRSYHGSSDYKSVVDYLMGEAGDGEEVTLWVRLLVHRVRNLINLQWPAVEGVATALLERRRLTREEVMDAIDVAYGLDPSWRKRFVNGLKRCSQTDC